jgi:Tetratricopeptide repeat
VTAYRAALEERTRERVPLQWATTQNNLGNALSTLGERESGTARLEEAVTAYRAALEEWTREAAPHWHDIAQHNLTRCLALIEQRRNP